MERLADLVLTWRRPLAAALVFLAVLAGLGAVRPDTTTRAAVVARHDLPSGTVLTADDLAVRSLPPEAIPDHTPATADARVGDRLAGPVRAGEALTDRRVLDPRDLSGWGEGDGVLTTVRVADAAGLQAVRAGDTVDLVAVDPHGEIEPRVVAAGAEVAARPSADRDRPEAGGVLVVVTDPETAVGLAAAALSTPLAVLTRG